MEKITNDSIAPGVGQDKEFNSPEEEAQALETQEGSEDTQETPESDNGIFFYVELFNGETEVYNNVDRMAADGGDQLLHLYNEGEQIAFYQSRGVKKAYFATDFSRF